MFALLFICFIKELKVELSEASLLPPTPKPQRPKWALVTFVQPDTDGHPCAFVFGCILCTAVASSGKALLPFPHPLVLESITTLLHRRSPPPGSPKAAEEVASVSVLGNGLAPDGCETLG